MMTPGGQEVVVEFSGSKGPPAECLGMSFTFPCAKTKRMGWYQCPQAPQHLIS